MVLVDVVSNNTEVTVGLRMESILRAGYMALYVDTAPRPHMLDTNRRSVECWPFHRPHKLTRVRQGNSSK